MSVRKAIISGRSSQPSDGVGDDVRLHPQEVSQGCGKPYGLRSMKERATLLGGDRTLPSMDILSPVIILDLKSFPWYLSCRFSGAVLQFPTPARRGCGELHCRSRYKKSSVLRPSTDLSVIDICSFFPARSCGLSLRRISDYHFCRILRGHAHIRSLGL